MKITVKTLQQKVFTVEAEPSETVGDLKEKILGSHGHAVANQKLIYSGKILPDTKTLESCEIKEKDFLVLMVSKPKIAAAAAPSTSTPANNQAETSAPTPASVPAATPADPVPQPSLPVTPIAAAPAATEPSFDSTSSFLSGAALQSTIANIQEMGFERDQIMRALRASFNNPERAVEYLMTGIPEGLEGVAAGNTPSGLGSAPAPAAAVLPRNAGSAILPNNAGDPATNTTVSTTAAAPASNAPQNLFALAQAAQGQHGGGVTSVGAGGAPPPSADLAALANSPQMAQIRNIMRQNPAMLQPILQQLMANNPSIRQQLQSNPEAILQLFSGDGSGEEDEDDQGAAGVQIQVTEEEQASIHRLEALGFPRNAVIQAFFACDKNEELAANFLFESGGFDD